MCNNMCNNVSSFLKHMLFANYTTIFKSGYGIKVLNKEVKH